MIRIGIDARSVCMLQRGMPVYAWNLLNNLPDKLPDIQFYFFINTAFEHNAKVSEYKPRIDTLKSFKNVEVVDIKHDAYMLWEQWLLFLACKKYKINLLHMPANRVCLFYAKKQIVTLHDTLEWDDARIIKCFNLKNGIRHAFYSLKAWSYLLLQYSLGIKRVRRLLTISKYAQTQITDRFIVARGKTDFIYHGLPAIFDKNSPLPLSNRKGVLMLGGESDHKNPFNMMKSYAALSLDIRQEFPLTIIGVAPHAMQKFESWIHELGITSDVNIFGWVDDNQLVSSFRTHRVLLFASKEEGFGFPLIQAMRSGTPVVTSKCEVLLELSNHVLPNAEWNDIHGLSRGLLALLKDDKHWQCVSENGYEISKSFSWECSTSEVAEIYEKELYAISKTSSI